MHRAATQRGIPLTHNPRTSPRAEYQQKENLRVAASPSLVERFPKLKLLTVELSFFDAGGSVRSSQIKYTVNPEHAKSVFRFGCHNPECVGGDFDLSDALVRAVMARHTTVSGELRCHGWRSRATIGSVECQNLLRYKLAIGYTA